MTDPNLLRLKRIEVDGLFDLYNHRIDFNLNERVTVLHGQNGVGKTAVLRMVNAILRGRFGILRNIPFTRLMLQFDDGATVELKEVSSEGDSSSRIVHLSLNGHGVNDESGIDLNLDTMDEASEVAAGIEFLSRHPSIEDTWVDIRDGEILSSNDVIGQFGGAAIRVRRRAMKKSPEPEWFQKFRENANCHLIEAQRLLRLEFSTPNEVRYYQSKPSMVPTVIVYARDFQRRISETMARYGRQSQLLDQSFPARLVTAEAAMKEDELKQRMTSLDEKRSELKNIGILDETPAPPFDVAALTDLDATQARVMTLYVHDTAEKLDALEDTSRRTRLLLENVNRKFQHKRIRLDRENGFVAESDTENLLALESLSSGEQQELVLHYDLLFRVLPNTIVLIDEPELSLHVAWQKRFLPELLEIVQIADFDALIATHSPYIIGDRADLMVGLGVDAE